MAIFRKKTESGNTVSILTTRSGGGANGLRSNFGSKREAQMAAAKEEAKLLNNTFLMDQNIWFDTFALEWLETFERPHVKESTYDQISRTVKNHFIPQFGEHRLIDINRVMYQK